MEIIEEKPVCLVEVIENPGDKDKPFIFKVNPEALELIDRLKSELVIFFNQSKKSNFLGRTYLSSRTSHQWQVIPLQPSPQKNVRLRKQQQIKKQ